MSQPKTKTCENCGEPIKSATRGRPKRYCSDICKQSAYRKRHAKPVTLDDLEKSQRRDDRYEVRRQQHGGARDASIFEEYRESGAGSTPADLVVIERDGTRTVLGSPYGTTKRGGTVARFRASSPFPPVEDEALWHLEGESAAQKWNRLRYDAAYEFAYGVLWPEFDPVCEHKQRDWPVLFLGLPLTAARVRQILWYWRWRHHPDLTEDQRIDIVWRLPASFRCAIHEQRRQEQMDAVLTELRGLRRDVQEGFAHVEARLAEIDRANPDDRDFERAVADLLEEARFS